MFLLIIYLRVRIFDESRTECIKRDTCIYMYVSHLLVLVCQNFYILSCVLNSKHNFRTCFVIREKKRKKMPFSTHSQFHSSTILSFDICSFHAPTRFESCPLFIFRQITKGRKKLAVTSITPR